jgi:hypothetical protein
MRSKQSQNSCEVKRSEGKPHSEERIVWRYHSSTSVLGPGRRDLEMVVAQLGRRETSAKSSEIAPLGAPL